MKRGNVLVLGNSGVGKSTLINAVLGDEKAKTGWGTTGTTSKLELYEPDNQEIPFRIIDSIGFQPGLFKQMAAIKAVKQWSKECAENGHEDHQINVIWFCVEGTSSKLFPQTIKNLTRAASIWKSVPVIVVITKSYSIPEREQNIELVHQAFAEQKGSVGHLSKIIPVVAKTYTLNESAYAAPEGITELINCTNELMPEGLRAAKKDLADFILTRKRVLAHGIVTTATAAGVTVGAVPFPFSDAVLLSPIELAEVNSIAKVFGIGKDEAGKRFLRTLVDVGTVSAGAKALISALKAIPGINIAASVVNSIIAGVIIAGLGEISVYAFEQIYLGNKSIDDLDWIKKFAEKHFSASIVEKIGQSLLNQKDIADKNAVVKNIVNLVSGVFKAKNDIDENMED